MGRAGSEASASVYTCVLISSSCKDTSHMGLGSALVTSFYYNHLFRKPILQILTHSEVLVIRIPMWISGLQPARDTE